MLAFDTNALPESPVVMVAQAASSNARSAERVMGICLPVEYLPQGRNQQYVEGDLDAVGTAISYFKRYERRAFVVAVYPNPVRDIQVVLRPKHGTVAVAHETIGGEPRVFWRYTPQPGYEGQDRVDLSVQVKGQPVRLVYFMQVTKKNLDTTPGEVFCKRPNWKISQSGFDSSRQDYAVWLRSSELSTLLATASRSFTSSTDLAGSSVGQTTGEGSGAQIALAKKGPGTN